MDKGARDPLESPDALRNLRAIFKWGAHEGLDFSPGPRFVFVVCKEEVSVCLSACPLGLKKEVSVHGTSVQETTTTNKSRPLLVR